MKKVFFRCNSPCFTQLLLFFTGKKIFKSSKWGFHETPTGPSCRTSRGPNDDTFWGRPGDVGHTCFLNSTQKHINPTSYFGRLLKALQ